MCPMCAPLHKTPNELNSRVVKEIKLHPLFVHSPDSSAKKNRLLFYLVTEVVVAKASQLAHKKVKRFHDILKMISL